MIWISAVSEAAGVKVRRSKSLYMIAMMRGPTAMNLDPTHNQTVTSWMKWTNIMQTGIRYILLACVQHAAFEHYTGVFT